MFRWTAADTLTQGARNWGAKGPPSQPSHFGMTTESAFTTSARSRFASVVLDGSLRPDGVLGCMSSGNNARGKSRALDGRRVSSKSTLRVRDGDEGVAIRD